VNPPNSSPPAVFFWFKVYTGFMTALYVGCLILAPVLFFIGTRSMGEERAVLMIQAVIFGSIGLVLAVACVLPFFLPRKPWVWVYDLVIICIGLTSCCFLPATIPLLIYWIKPETKAWFQQA